MTTTRISEVVSDNFRVFQDIFLTIILQLPDCWLEVSIRKVLRPATSAEVFLGFPVSKSER